MASEMATSTTIYINARWYVLFFYVSTTTGARRSSCSPQTDLTELTRRLFQHVWSFPRRRRRRRTSFLHRLSCRRLTFASHHPPFHSRRILNISRFLHTFTYILNATPSTLMPFILVRDFWRLSAECDSFFFRSFFVTDVSPWLRQNPFSLFLFLMKTGHHLWNADASPTRVS